MKIGISYDIYFSYTKRYFTNGRTEKGNLILCIDSSNKVKERIKIAVENGTHIFQVCWGNDSANRIEELFGVEGDKVKREEMMKWLNEQMDKIKVIDSTFSWDWQN